MLTAHPSSASCRKQNPRELASTAQEGRKSNPSSSRRREASSFQRFSRRRSLHASKRRQTWRMKQNELQQRKIHGLWDCHRTCPVRRPHDGNRRFHAVKKSLQSGSFVLDVCVSFYGQVTANAPDQDAEKDDAEAHIGKKREQRDKLDERDCLLEF